MPRQNRVRNSESRMKPKILQFDRFLDLLMITL